MPTIRDFWIGLKAVLRSARQLVNKELEGLHLTSAQGDALFYLLTEQDGFTQEQLAQWLDVDKGAISRTVDSLAEKGYVRRERHLSDGRAYRVLLTEKAVEIGPAVTSAYQKVYEAAGKGIPEAEFRRLGTLLHLVAESLQKMEDSI